MGGVVWVQGRGGWLMEGTRTYSARPSVRPVALQRRRAPEHDEALPAVLRGHARQRVAASRPWIVAPLVDVELRAQHRAASHATTTGRLSLSTPKSLIYLFFQKKNNNKMRLHAILLFYLEASASPFIRARRATPCVCRQIKRIQHEHPTLRASCVCECVCSPRRSAGCEEMRARAAKHHKAHHLFGGAFGREKSVII